jgi:hypothetical protein
VVDGNENDNAATGSRTITDGAGNSATAGPIAGNKIDRKAPTYSLGSADTDWHAANVTIACTAADGGSGLNPATDAHFGLSTSVAADTETNNASTGTKVLTDNVGNTVTTGSIGGNKIDRKAPTIVPDTPAPVFTLNQSPAVVWGTATDGGSGPASQRVSANATTSPVGPKTVTLTALDAVGNMATVDAPYNVIYKWTGFFRPVDNPPVVNIVKAGSAIPVKFSLSGFKSYDIFADGYPRSVKAVCDTWALTDLIEETVTAGGSSLNYDSAADQYIYVWKTDKAYAGTCRQLQVQLIDGTLHNAFFKFTK